MEQFLKEFWYKEICSSLLAARSNRTCEGSFIGAKATSLQDGFV